LRQIFDNKENDYKHSETLKCKKKNRKYKKEKVTIENTDKHPSIDLPKETKELDSLYDESQQFDDSFSDYNELDQLNNSDFNNDESKSFQMNYYDEDQSKSKKKRVLSRSQRLAANQRERKRMNIMNESFLKLKQKLPFTTGRKRRKMSRLDIVVGALEYIYYLDQLLLKDVPGEINFDAYQNSIYDY
jgi:hypothetical protein